MLKKNIIILYIMEKKFIKIFIITYNNDLVLNNALESLFASDFTNYENTQVNIINNYSSININERFTKDYNINIINNETRADYFNPNLSQNHNQAIIHGFKDLKNPESEIVIHTHNDIVFTKDWVHQLLKCTEKYNIIFGSLGDQFVAYKAEGIKRVGLWDENFPGLVHNECDFMLRSILFNSEKTYINDLMHDRTFNNSINYIFDKKKKIKGKRYFKKRIEF